MSTNILADFSVQYPQPSDDQLIFEAKCGNRGAFTELCQRYNGLLKQTIFRIVRHREDTEDVLQETFLKAYQHLHSFRGECRFSHWITKIGTNTSLMLLRKRKRLSRHTSDIGTDDGQAFLMLEFRDTEPDPEQRCITGQTHQTLALAIQRLPPKLRSMMQLYYESELCMSDAAETLGISQSAAKTRLLRARNMLRPLLKTPWNERRRQCTSTRPNSLDCSTH